MDLCKSTKFNNIKISKRNNNFHESSKSRSIVQNMISCSVTNRKIKKRTEFSIYKIHI